MNTTTQMKANFNQLCGRVITEPTYRKLSDGEKSLLTFSLLYNTIQKTDKDGSNANFIDIEIWNKAADMFSDILSKGLEILINGAFVQKRFINKEGKKTSKFIFSANYISISDLNFKSLDKKKATTEEEALPTAA